MDPYNLYSVWSSLANIEQIQVYFVSLPISEPVSLASLMALPTVGSFVSLTNIVINPLTAGMVYTQMQASCPYSPDINGNCTIYGYYCLFPGSPSVLADYNTFQMPVKLFKPSQIYNMPFNILASTTDTSED